MNELSTINQQSNANSLFYALTATVLGALFGLGLIISGLANPIKIISFLDITGQWDASLIFVMLGAIMVVFIPMQRAIRHPCTLSGQTIHLPTQTQLDYKLVVGAIIFGIGWAIAGICPGPSFALLGLGHIEGVYFLLAMGLGVWLQRKLSGVE
ncbi:DUF6691 family protein [Acinetobacter rudis]|uniref:Sulphur transport domain-containing protein n=1 Tax=Acinetobacter rudis CIP 110305 TaxID=421052 RepID=S3NG96_9GAMM|nr:DUF6691 family protein [Acinetobacter rudis]EPF73354.1 hypothetical protein F945_02110 [Acinetobacter rudis CIP 110305]